MRLHVLAGCGALLRPLLPPPAALAALVGPPEGALVGPPLQAPAAAWLARGAGAADHDFLLEPAEDARVAVFAAALRDNFGARVEPLTLLPDALGTPGAPAAAPAAIAALHALWRLRPAARLVLHAIVLPEAVDGGAGWVAAAGLDAATARRRLEALRDSLAAEGGDVGAIEVATVAPAPGSGIFGTALRNALAHEAAARAGASLAPAGLAAAPGLAAAAARRLAAWDAQGVVPGLPLDAGALDRLASRLVASLVEGEIDA